jgi:hypothetical protein
METRTITTVFDHVTEAESAIGRLEVAGILPADISILGSDPKEEGVGAVGGIVVTATIEPRLYEKAMSILTGEGLVERQTCTK